jgi:hypothetical protein
VDTPDLLENGDDTAGIGSVIAKPTFEEAPYLGTRMLSTVIFSEKTEPDVKLDSRSVNIVNVPFTLLITGKATFPGLYTISAFLGFSFAAFEYIGAPAAITLRLKDLLAR